MSELKKCPFCGGEAIAFHCAGKYLAKCIQCQVEIVRSTREETDAAWNRRAQPDHSGDVTGMIVQPDNEAHGLTAWETPESCPNCNEHLSKDWSYCPECGRVTDWADNVPLTLGELRGMDGEPVYIVELCYAPNNRWEILGRKCPVDIEAQDVNFESGDCYPTYTLGKTWLAYRRKPEPEGGEG